MRLRVMILIDCLSGWDGLNVFLGPYILRLLASCYSCDVSLNIQEPPVNRL